MIKDLDEDEKKLMSTTFENTVKNAKNIQIKNVETEPKRKNKKVSINLENNKYFNLPSLLE